MSAFDPDFRDLRQRLAQARQAAATAPTPGGSTSKTEPTPGPQMLGRYRVDRVLGRGSMGVVYLGSDTKIGRTVAIKTLALAEEFEEGDVEAVKARFFREAETAGRLSHPNIVTVYDAGEDGELAYIAMEYLQGDDLIAHTRADALLPLAESMEVIAKCADALAYAHSQRVVHRDVKPANIVYDARRGELKITDFGIARITDASRTKTGVVLGTPSYMSPEQLTGQPVDGRSDLFSLGVMLFQLATGQLPFQAESISSLMYRIANEPHPPLRALRRDAPPCLQAIVDRALAKQRTERYQSGVAMARELRSCARMVGA
jgi:serine/threonine-protein kinase